MNLMKVKIVDISFHSTIGHIVIQIEVVSKIDLARIKSPRGGMFVRGQLKNISYPGNLMSKAKKKIVSWSFCTVYVEN